MRRFWLTSVDKSPRGTFAELLGLVGQRDFHNTRDVPRRSLNTDGVGGYQLDHGYKKERKKWFLYKKGFAACEAKFINIFLILLSNLCSKTKMHTSLHTSIVPNTTCRPSKKLSPMMMTVAPPVVHPSLGLIALMHGVAAYARQREEQIQHLCFNTQNTCLHSLNWAHYYITSTFSPSCLSHKDILWKLPQK